MVVVADDLSRAAVIRLVTCASTFWGGAVVRLIIMRNTDSGMVANSPGGGSEEFELGVRVDVRVGPNSKFQSSREAPWQERTGRTPSMAFSSHF